MLYFQLLDYGHPLFLFNHPKDINLNYRIIMLYVFSSLSCVSTQVMENIIMFLYDQTANAGKKGGAMSMLVLSYVTVGPGTSGSG